MGGGADADVHVFYNCVAGFKGYYGSGAHLSEFLGNVVAHELPMRSKAWRGIPAKGS